MTRKILVGMLLLGALFIFGLATFYVENWQFYLGKGYRLVARFPVAHTLDTGDLVRIAGVPAGTVKELTIDTETATAKPVTAVLLIQDEFKVHADDTATIRISSFFGGNYISIDRGDKAAPELRDGDEIRKTAVSAGITEVVEQSQAALAEVRTAIGQITEITTQLREGEGTLGKLLMDEELANKLDSVADQATSVLEGFKTASDRLQQGEGALGKLLMDDELAEQLSTAARDATEVAANLKEVSADLHNGKGTIGRLFADEELYAELKDTVDTIGDFADKANNGNGILAKLLSDEDLAQDIRTFAADARQVATDMKDISAEMRGGDSSFMASLENLKDITDAIANGEGTLGKLVRDDQVYQQISGLLDAVQGIVDTYREQSPVISLAGAVFGAF